MRDLVNELKDKRRLAEVVRRSVNDLYKEYNRTHEIWCKLVEECFDLEDRIEQERSEENERGDNDGLRR